MFEPNEHLHACSCWHLICHAQPTSTQKTRMAGLYKKQHAWYLEAAEGATCATTQTFDAQSPFSISTACTCCSACPDMLTCTLTVQGTCWTHQVKQTQEQWVVLDFHCSTAVQFFSINPRLPVCLLCAAKQTCGSCLPQQLCCSSEFCSDQTSMREWSCNTTLVSSAPASWMRLTMPKIFALSCLSVRSD